MSRPETMEAKRARWAEERAEGERRERALADGLVGRKVLAILFDHEDRAPYIVLDDGRALVVMSDPEGNGPGALHVYAKPGEFSGVVGGR